MKVICPKHRDCTEKKCQHKLVHKHNSCCYRGGFCPDCEKDIKEIRKDKLINLKSKSYGKS